MSTRKKLRGYLQNEIRMRYAENSILDYDDNTIIRKMFTDRDWQQDAVSNYKIINNNLISMSSKLLESSDVDLNNIPKSFTDPLMNQILDDLGIRPTKEDLQTIRENNTKLCLVGYGGATINMLYNIYLWAIKLSEMQIFENIVIFDKDNIDFSNLPRIGKNVALNFIPKILTQEHSEFSFLNFLKKIDLVTVEKELSKRRKIITFAQWLQDEHVRHLKSKDYVMVGAPTLDTRRMLQKEDANFYFLGHAGNEVEITYQPEIVSSLTTETYGSIDIPVLLINLQIATAAFIKQLAKNEQPSKNEKIFELDLKKEKERIDGV